MFLNIWNHPKHIICVYDIFSLILCYFSRQNCLKTSFLALWATLVNTCWPYVCDMTKWSLGACKYLSQVPSPQISRQEIQNSSRGVEKTIFFVSIVSWWNNHLQIKNYISAKNYILQRVLKSERIWRIFCTNLISLVLRSKKWAS